MDHLDSRVPLYLQDAKEILLEVGVEDPTDGCLKHNFSLTLCSGSQSLAASITIRSNPPPDEDQLCFSLFTWAAVAQLEQTVQ